MKYAVNVITLVLFALLLPTLSTGAILFEDNFDNHADWSPSQVNQNDCWGSSCTSQPTGYYGYHLQATVYSNTKHNTLNIDSTNHRGASGKALTVYQESAIDKGTAYFVSDGLLMIPLASNGYDEVYVRFFVKFQTSPAWQWMVNQSNSPQWKFFRISHYDYSSNRPISFGPLTTDTHYPLTIVDIAKYNRGSADAELRIAARYTNQYYPDRPVYLGDDSFDVYIPPANYGGTGAEWYDSGQPGDGSWHCYEFYVKLNSAQGVADGKYKIWYDGNLVLNETNLMWWDPGTKPKQKWNMVMLGGNSNNHWTDSSAQAEQWYAIDDLVISTTYIGPNYVIGGGPAPDTMPPAAPQQLR